jgi:hypothetical protein
MQRKPVTATVLGAILVVVCDDGSVWELDPDFHWVERQPIPGTAAAMVAPQLVELPDITE